MDGDTFEYATFRGTDASVHYARLRLPRDGGGAPAPVVVNYHGGFWKTSWGLHNLPTAELLGAFGE